LERRKSPSQLLAQQRLFAAMSEPNNKEDIKTEDADKSQLESATKATSPGVKDDSSDKVMIQSDEEGAESPTKTETTSKDETVAVAAMAVAADDEGIESGSEKKTDNGDKVKNEDDPSADVTTGTGVGTAAEGADKSKEEKKEEAQSVEAAAAEAGLTVVQAPHETSPIGGANTTVPIAVPPSEESSYPYHVNAGKDVISGKGGKVQQYNRHFRNLVAESYPAYDATTSKIAKRRIGVAIYTNIIEKGGRFLDAQGKEMDRSKAVLKVMKALKDAKTWTSDAKRAAKERRESKQKDGTEMPSSGPTGKGEKEQKTETKPPPPTNGKVPEPNPVPELAKTETPAVVEPVTAAAEENGNEENPKEVKEEEKPTETTTTPPTEAPANDENENEPKMEVNTEGEEEEAEPESEEKTEVNAAEKADKKKSGKSQKEPPPPNTRPRRTSKRRVQLPLSGSPPTKTAKKGEDVVDSTNDAVRGLHLLSQATQAMTKKTKPKNDDV